MSEKTARRKERHRAVPLLPEVRHWRATGLEVRSNARTDEIVISGSPIVYNKDYVVPDMFGEFVERMRPGVVRDLLPNRPDVRFLFNHEGLPLARTLAGTLSLQDSDTELRFTACLDARQQLANDLAIAIERGDVSQMSCAFIVGRDEWDDDMEDRSIHELADLHDVSAVTYPASPTTSIQVAQRMALAVPVESRARARHLVARASAGERLSKEDVAALRAMVLDPGDSLRTPAGTGRLGNPVGSGRTYADPGNRAGTQDGTSGSVTMDAPMITSQDGTGTRSTSRATRIRMKRALRGV